MKQRKLKVFKVVASSDINRVGLFVKKMTTPVINTNHLNNINYGIKGTY